MVMTKSSSLTQVSNFIAKVNGEKPNTVRQRLKEWYQEAEAKTGKKRSSLDVSSCFAPLMRWVISLLPRNIEQIALALDATSISDKFVVLSLNMRACRMWHPHSVVCGQSKRSGKLETPLAKTHRKTERGNSLPLSGNSDG
jgi:hypothetical protein